MPCITLKSGKKGKELVWMEVTDGTILLRQEILGGEFINLYNKQEEITHQLKVTKKSKYRALQ